MAVRPSAVQGSSLIDVDEVGVEDRGHDAGADEHPAHAWRAAARPGLRLTVADADGAAVGGGLLGHGHGGRSGALAPLALCHQAVSAGIGIRRSSDLAGREPGDAQGGRAGPTAQRVGGDRAPPARRRRPRCRGARPRRARRAMTAAGGAARRSSMFMDTWAMPASGRYRPMARTPGRPPPASRTRAAMARASVSVPSGSQTLRAISGGAHAHQHHPGAGVHAVRAGVGHDLALLDQAGRAPRGRRAGSRAGARARDRWPPPRRGTPAG